jgi:hypothetical protein
MRHAETSLPVMPKIEDVPGQPGWTPDELFSHTLYRLLTEAGRVGVSRLLDRIPEDKRDIQPKVFKELYTAVK